MTDTDSATTDEEFEALQEAVIMSAELAVFPEDREVRGIYSTEQRVIFHPPAKNWRCRLFGHKLDRDPTLDPETKEQIGVSEWCRRCGDVLDHDVEGGDSA